VLELQTDGTTLFSSSKTHILVLVVVVVVVVVCCCWTDGTIKTKQMVEKARMIP
jgi:hypothetical protein